MCFKIDNMKKVLTLIILLNFLIAPAANAAEDALPELPVLPSLEIYNDTTDSMDAFSPSATPPKIAPKESAQTSKPVQPAATPPKAVVQKPAANTVTYSKNSSSTAITVPKGKKFKVRLAQKISSSTPKGTRISFKSLYPETSRYVTIPAGTIFYGKISDSHGPQITGNGGLIEIVVTQMNYKGRTYNIDAKVCVANERNIFFNNIKGQRMYWRSFPKVMKPGTNFFKKMWKVTKNLAKNENGVEIILTPFSFVTGTVVYVVNLAVSPVLAIFYKGKSITIPAGSEFVIKLREDAVLSQ